MKSCLKLAFVLLVLSSAWPICASGINNPNVVLETNFGDIVVELYPENAPITVDNFLGYVNSGFYDGLIFHRVVENFMLQGGGYYFIHPYIYYAQPGAPIILESYNGLSNLRGTIAMARTSDPNSATSQFFINHMDNPNLDRENAEDGFGYCVFGRVVSGMEVVDDIAQTNTIYVNSSMTHFPYNPTVDIYRAYVLPCKSPSCSDFSGDGELSGKDFTIFASNWLGNDCNSVNDFCAGTDLNYDGISDFADFALFSGNISTPTKQ